MPFIRFTQKCSNSYTGREQKICLLGSIKINAVNPCCKKRHEAIKKTRKKERIKERKERKKKKGEEEKGENKDRPSSHKNFPSANEERDIF